MLEVVAPFAVLDDPRAANARYELAAFLFIAIAATLTGAKTWLDMAEFGDAKEELLRQVLELLARHFFE